MTGQPGRPPIYNSPEELEAKITEYFKEGVKKRQVQVTRNGKPEVIEIPVPTITGLCIYLGFESRQSFYDYEKREGFSYTIKKARLFIENEYEEMLAAGNTTGAIFALKNFGWTDRQEIEQKTTLQDNRIDESKLTDDELRTLADIQSKYRSRQA